MSTYSQNLLNKVRLRLFLVLTPALILATNCFLFSNQDQEAIKLNNQLFEILKEPIESFDRLEPTSVDELNAGVKSLIEQLKSAKAKVEAFQKIPKKIKSLVNRSHKFLDNFNKKLAACQDASEDDVKWELWKTSITWYNDAWKSVVDDQKVLFKK